MRADMAGPATPAAAYRLISIPEAQETVLRHALPLPPQRVGLGSAVGRILLQDVLAPEPLPPFPASIKACTLQVPHQVLAQALAVREPEAMQDGYAVRSSDGPGDHTVEFEAMAGTAPGRLSAGHVAYIGTGVVLVCTLILVLWEHAVPVLPESRKLFRWPASRGRRRGGADREHGAAAARAQRQATRSHSQGRFLRACRAR